MEHYFAEESDGEEELPRKRLELDPEYSETIDSGLLEWEPTPEEYEQYERLLWQAEFRKLLELDENSMKNEMQRNSVPKPNTREAEFSSESELSSSEEDLEEVKSKMVTHPLLNEEVLDQIMSYMDYHHDKETLENCQLVCRRWTSAVHRRLDRVISDDSFKLTTKIGDLSIVEEELRHVPRHCHTFNIQLPPKKPPVVETILRSVGPRVQELDISFKIKDKHWPNPPIDHFGDYLEQYCPRLEKLKLCLSSSEHYPEQIFTHDIPHFLPIKHIETEDFEDHNKTHIFEEIIEASPFLESLTFQHESTQLMCKMLEILESRGRLRQIKSLESYHYELDDTFVAFALQHYWNIQSLKISFTKDVSIQRIRALLYHVKETLTSFEILYKGQDYDPSLPIEDTWVIPVALRKLKHLSVSPNIFSNACRFLVNALQLPNLKSFGMKSTCSWSEKYFEAVWRRNRIKLKEPSIEVLEIPCSCLDPTIFLQDPNPFRKLKELVLDSPSIKVLQAVFLAEMKLERLKIFELYSLSHYTWDDIMTGYFSDLHGRPLIWDEILTGCKKPEYTLMYKMAPTPLLECVPSIRNLKHLKFLLLDFKTPHEKVSDFFIYQGLMHLTELQHVDINRHSFTDGAVDELRVQLVQFCHLELGTDSDSDDEV